MSSSLDVDPAGVRVGEVVQLGAASTRADRADDVPAAVTNSAAMACPRPREAPMIRRVGVVVMPFTVNAKLMDGVSKSAGSGPWSLGGLTTFARKHDANRRDGSFALARAKGTAGPPSSPCHAERRDSIPDASHSSADRRSCARHNSQRCGSDNSHYQVCAAGRPPR